MRLAWIERAFLTALCVLVAALAVFQIVLGPRYRRMAEQNRIRLIPLPAVRGSILDWHGVPLAEDHLAFNVAVIPQELVGDSERLWPALAAALERPEAQLRRAYRRGYTAPFAPVVVARDVDRELAFAIEERRWESPGVVVLPVPKRTYPLGVAEGAVIGYLGLVDPQQLKLLKPYGYTMRDWVGKSGLEQLYDAVLRGVDWGVQVEVDHRGRMVRQLGLKAPVQGKDITVTLDAGLQQHCQQLLVGRRGAVLVMALDSGALLAAVSSPGFDPGAFVDPDRDDEVEAYLSDEDRPLFNRAVAAAVPPGSVFKIVTAYAGLASRRGSPNTTYVCPGSFRLGRATLHCWYEGGHGPQTVVEALTHSCNVFFWQWGLRAGPEAIAEHAPRFGFGRLSRIDLPGEVAGFVPDPAWKRERRREPWYRGETANLAIGQGALLVTPVQVLRMIASAATDGRAPQPHLLRTIAGQVVGPPPAPAMELDRAALKVIRRGLEAVVDSATGTGRLARVETMLAAGKTGTAQTGTTATHAWFCGYAPARQPRYALVVFVERGGKGGDVAAGIAGRILEALAQLDHGLTGLAVQGQRVVG